MSGQSRQLAAIMFTDIVGYTALMGNDEQKAFEILKKNRLLQKPVIEKYNGKWIKELGDGVMASFTTATDAVAAAMEIQKACITANDFKLRIGLHMGEVVFEESDVFGDGVNIASRIETLGVGGAILLSKSIRDQIKNNTEVEVVSLGSYEFKNVDEAVHIFAISNPGFVIPREEDMKGKMKISSTKKGIPVKILVPVISLLVLLVGYFSLKDLFFKSAVGGDIKSLAVLPFDNVENDSSLYFLSNGIPENLINRLAAFADIKVFARSATFGLNDSVLSITSLKKLLNADMVLTGQLQQNDGVNYISCQLVDAATQSQIWGNKYELKNNDISGIEDAIINALMNPLKISLVGKTKNKEINPDAYAEYLKGRYLSYGSTPEESEKALAHFREAIRIDPKYAAAYAALANEKIVQGLFSTASKNEIVNEARTAIEAAKALDPDIAEIYTSEGALKFYYDWDWKGAVASYKKALELDPGNANIYIRYSTTLADVGRYKEALPLADKAVELDPVSISSLHNLGWVNLLAGNFEKSKDAFGKAIELHPNWVWGYIKKAYGHMYLNEFDKAISLTERAEQLFKDGWGSELLQVTLVFIYTTCNKQDKADTVINRFLKYAAENTVKDPFTMASIYLYKGNLKKANEWEEKTVEAKSPSAYLMNLSLFYDKKYFESKEHQAILKKMGFVK